MHRALDLSRNSFTLDTTAQRASFAAALAPLTSLQALSVAYNKIQHDGFALVVSLINDHLQAVRQLDLAGCFIAAKSYSTLLSLLELKWDHGDHPDYNSHASSNSSSNGDDAIGSAAGEASMPRGPRQVSQLEELLFQDNLLSYAQTTELHSTYGYRTDIRIALAPPHLGIAYPLRYELRDYDIHTYYR